MANWYLLPSKTAREFILIIGMTQHPGKITAGGLIELSCYGFTSVCIEFFFLFSLHLYKISNFCPVK